MQSLIDTDLISAEGSAALEDKNHLPVFVLPKLIYCVLN
jgi:hypothetical protein